MVHENINLYDRDTSFWEDYQRGRPQVPDSFFERIYSYHEKRGGSFNAVHDAGAGVGIHSARLGARFHHVHVSDVSRQNLEIAKARLRRDSKYSFYEEKFGDASQVPAASLDLFFSSTAIHFAGRRIDAAIASAASQLKSGGTIAIAGFGLATFDDSTLQEAWIRLFQHGIGAWMSAQGQQLDTVQSVQEIGASAYDAVPLPENFFLPGAQRLKVNFSDGWTWRSMQIPSSGSPEVPIVDRTGEHDVVVFETDPEWTFTWTPEDIRAHKATMPFLRGPEAEKLWSICEDIVGDRRVTGQWPMILLLATRA